MAIALLIAAQVAGLLMIPLGLVGAFMGVPVPIIGSVVGAFAGSFLGELLAEYSVTRDHGQAGFGLAIAVIFVVRSF